jgi:hypothetical protein
MDDLLRVMQIIDQHSNVLPEGDYLELCKHLKNAYNRRADPVYFLITRILGYTVSVKPKKLFNIFMIIISIRLSI